MREVGIRMAVGATPTHLLARFLIEAIVPAGSLIGVLLGLVVAVPLTGLLDWPLVISPIAALCAAVAVGLFLGYLPAWKASRLESLEALRHE